MLPQNALSWSLTGTRAVCRPVCLSELCPPDLPPGLLGREVGDRLTGGVEEDPAD